MFERLATSLSLDWLLSQLLSSYAAHTGPKLLLMWIWQFADVKPSKIVIQHPNRQISQHPAS